MGACTAGPEAQTPSRTPRCKPTGPLQAHLWGMRPSARKVSGAPATCLAPAPGPRPFPWAPPATDRTFLDAEATCRVWSWEGRGHSPSRLTGRPSCPVLLAPWADLGDGVLVLWPLPKPTPGPVTLAFTPPRSLAEQCHHRLPQESPGPMSGLLWWGSLPHPISQAPGPGGGHSQCLTIPGISTVPPCLPMSSLKTDPGKDGPQSQSRAPLSVCPLSPAGRWGLPHCQEHRAPGWRGPGPRRHGSTAPHTGHPLCCPGQS